MPTGGNKSGNEGAGKGACKGAGKSGDESGRSARDTARRLAEVVADAHAATEGRRAGGEPAGLAQVAPEDDLMKQADLLDLLLPRALRGAASIAGSASGLRRKAVGAAYKAAAPLRAELDAILDFADGVAAAYRVLAERVLAIEARLDEFGETRLPRGEGDSAVGGE